MQSGDVASELLGIRDMRHTSVANVHIGRYYLTQAETAHIIAPDYPRHISQRGNNRAKVSFDDIVESELNQDTQPKESY